MNLMENEIACLTEVSADSAHLTKVAIYSFIETNPWFDGTIYLAEDPFSPLKGFDLTQIKSIYPKIQVVSLKKSPIYQLIEAKNPTWVKAKNFSTALLKTLIFNLPTKRVLYFSNTSLFLNSVNRLLIPNKLVFSKDSLFYLSKDISDLAIQKYSDFLETSQFFSPAELNQAFYRILNEESTPFILDEFHYSASYFTNSKFNLLSPKLKHAEYLNFDTFILKASNYSRINSIWLQKNNQLRKELSRPRSIYRSPLVTSKSNTTNLATSIINKENYSNKKTSTLQVYKNSSKIYLDVNMSTDDVIQLIQEKIQNGEPFCLTRFGDGDLNIIRKHFDKRWLDRGFKKQGIVEGSFSQKHEKLKKVILSAMSDSDIIGIMSHATIKKFGFKSEKWSITPSDIAEYGLKELDKFKICDHQMTHSFNFGQINNFKKIIGTTPIHIISHHYKFLKENNISELLGVPVTYSESPAYFYANRQKVIDNFKNIEEKVVLYACSGGGKDVGIILKNQYQKIAIDMGSVLDAWAGVISRIRFQQGKDYEYLVVGQPRFNTAYSLKQPGARESSDN